MTLIAAYRIYGVPVLMGDLLLTKAESDSSIKKITKIGKNLAVGWAGDFFIAKPILKKL